MGLGAANRKASLSRLCRRGTVIRAWGIEELPPYLKEMVIIREGDN